MLEERGTKGHTEKKGLFDIERRRCGEKEKETRASRRENVRARERVEECLVVVLGINVSVGYGVATVSRIDEITGLFCRISSL